MAAPRLSESNIACERCRASKRRCDRQLPNCSLCVRQSKECVYQKDMRSRKRKYWDEDYVRSLEDQVQSLLSALNKSALGESSSHPDSRALSQQSSSPCPSPLSRHLGNDDLDAVTTEHTRSQTAVDELSVMMWRTNLGDGVPIVDDIVVNTRQPVQACGPSSKDRVVQAPAQILALCSSTDILDHLSRLFLDHINVDHQFTSYTSTDFLLGFPFQTNELNLLHSAILAVGATYSSRADARAAGEEFATFAESLLLICCRQSPTCSVIQALSMLSWRSLALGIDQFAWIFISMAAGIAVHLRLHVLALDEFSARSFQPTVEEIRTFWTFYMTDRTAVSILGRNCGLPWRRVNVPTIETSSHGIEPTLAEVSFAWQCKLWYMHDRSMDQIYAPTFDNLPSNEKVRLLVSTHHSLSSFFKSIDEPLAIGRAQPSRPVLLFHMAYQMAFLITMPPFLHLSAASNSEETLDPDFMFMILRTLTHAAASMTRLARKYLSLYDYRTANPVLIHHVLSAAIVHLMNATSTSTTVREQSSRFLRSCLESLTLMRTTWPQRANKSIRMIRVLAYRWRVVFALPIQYSNSVDIGSSMDETVVETKGPAVETPEVQDSSLFMSQAPSDAAIAAFYHSTSTTFKSEARSYPMENALATNQLLPENAEDVEFLTAFGTLNEADDFNWLFGDTSLPEFIYEPTGLQ